MDKKTLRMIAPAFVLVMTGCATTQTPPADAGSNQWDALREKEAEITRLQSELDTARRAASKPMAPAPAPMPVVDTLLPPNAKTGECYARVWVAPTYRTLSKKMLVREASEQVKAVPARYEWVKETVLVKEASSRLKNIPAVYGTEKDTMKVSDAKTVWRTDLKRSAPPASNELLATARKYGIDLDAAKPGMCFHEHYRPAQYKSVDNQVLVNEATSTLRVTAPKYRWVEQQVLVREATSRLVEVPAVYGWEEERLVDKPAHTTWKKGTGPIQRIDDTTGEIMCLVEVPATYKTVRKRVLKTAASTRRVDIPAEYKTVKVRELVSGPGETRTEVPAKYKSVSSKQLVADASFVWHEVHNRQEPATTRTGAKICLTEEPAVYRTVTRTVVKTPATTRKVEIPAEYKTLKVRKQVSGPTETRTTLPAQYKTVSYQELGKEGFMEWRSILCKTNMTGTRVTQIQRALKTAGYNPGPIDGVIGRQTMTAVNAFQRNKKLPVDRYLNVQTLKALGVSAR